jgi:uncharacterized membrane protein YebE (DUF533 family)
MEELIKVIADPLGALLLGLVNAGVVLAIRWIHNRTKNERAQAAVTAIGDVTTATVARLNQQVVNALKNDGKFDEAEKAQIKQVALKSINEQLRPEVRKAAGGFLDDLDAYIDSKLEEAVGAPKPQV